LGQKKEHDTERRRGGEAKGREGKKKGGLGKTVVLKKKKVGTKAKRNRVGSVTEKVGKGGLRGERQHVHHGFVDRDMKWENGKGKVQHAG